MLSIIYLSLAVVLLSCGQIAQKLAANRLAATSRNSSWALVSCPEVWWAAGCLALGLVAWLAALSSVEVSKAYPLLSLSFVVTALIAKFHLGEFLSGARWLGIALISLGAAMVAMA